MANLRGRPIIGDEERQRNRQLHANARTRRRQAALDSARGAFAYDPERDYQADIGSMTVVCEYCKAKRYPKESKNFCCSGGKVQLPPLSDPPAEMAAYMTGSDSTSRHFLSNMNRYNSCFQMTSFGATNVVSKDQGFFPTFKVQGQVYHKVGSLLPMPNKDPSFIQIYFMGNEEIEANLRNSLIPGTRKEIILDLQQMLHTHNRLIQMFTTSLEKMPSDDFKVCIKADRAPANSHPRRFNQQVAQETAVIIGTEFDTESRDIIIQRRGQFLQRINETHRLYDSLQYPLIFCSGEDGYHFNFSLADPRTNEATAKKVSATQFYCHRLMVRDGSTNHILQCRQLFQQFVVDMYAKIESERLLYIRLNQKKLRVDEYIHLRDSLLSDGNVSVSDLGKMVILPATFSGSPRHMQMYAMDALTYVKNFGKADLFITFTANSRWDEISCELFGGQSPSDRHDIVARVFRQKLLKLIDELKSSHIFGELYAWMYTIEWQKRGLPHAHILIWCKEKIRPTQVDDIISAEIPDPTQDPILHEIVARTMIHGPCGQLNSTAPCMQNGKCTKHFPKTFVNETQTGEDGYPRYQRRKPDEGGFTAKHTFKTAAGCRSTVDVDNRWVVPYCPFLSKMFNAHINVEYCNSVKSIKYLCKYIHKGSDMAVFNVENELDEVTRFQMGRYISSNEAIWRIYSFPIHDRHPAVVQLTVHLENGQRVYFTAESAHRAAIDPNETTLTAFFKLCQEDEFAKTLFYHEVPRYYTWNAKDKCFKRRVQGSPVENFPEIRSSDTLGRVYTVHPSQAECFYLRLLLFTVRGPTSFVDLRTVDGFVCNTYRQACEKHGLLENDQHWEKALQEASSTSSASQLRNLFALILTTCCPSNPQKLWDDYKEAMSDDILHSVRKNNPNVNYCFEIFNKSLLLIDEKCQTMKGRPVEFFGLEAPNREQSAAVPSRDYLREVDFDTTELQQFVDKNVPLLTDDQKHVFENLIEKIDKGHGGLIFLSAPGGTGKTFLINLILAEVRKNSGIAMAVASSGIAATLLSGGRTAHSALRLPMDIAMQETPICDIKKSSGQAKVLQECKVLIWDECTMAHKKSLEALDRTLQDLRGNSRLMGGALVVLAGDFRQTLPVIKRSTPADELNACLKASRLWRHVQTFTLTTNMRVHLQGDTSAESFSSKLLSLGDGKFADSLDNYDVKLSSEFCNLVLSVSELIEHVFPDIEQNFMDMQWLCERAILAPRNDDVNNINLVIQNKIPGNSLTTYKSIDTLVQTEEVVNYPIEFLNSLQPSGMPPHLLMLKIGSPIMLLRNLDPPRLCNGTRLCIKALHPNIIEATILSGNYKGDIVYIPRIPLISTDMPFEFKRLQFPVRLSFAMTINKAQGQSLKVAGVNLSTGCFSHGQLYVACSRVGCAKNLYIFAPNGITKNIVYPKALQ